MADVLNIGRSVKNLRTTPKFFPVSAIRMIVSDNKDYESGTDTGYEFEAESPWATQEQSDWLLTKMQGLEYSPFEADTGQLRPEAEIGDYVNIRGVFGGLFSEDITFGKGYTATFGSPADEDIDHEYKFESRQDRSLRQKMSKKSPTGNTAFGWELDDDHWSVFNEDDNDNKQEIFRVSAEGAWLKGSFEIVGGSIHIQNEAGTQVFQVDENGNLYATTGTFAGAVYAGNVQYGVDSATQTDRGTFSGSGLSSSSVGTGKVTQGINTSLGYADYSHSVFEGLTKVWDLLVDTIHISSNIYFNDLGTGWIQVSTPTGTAWALGRSSLT